MSRTPFIRLLLLTSCLSAGVASAQDWTPLFDGQSLSGWMHDDGRAVDAPAWEVTNGMLHLNRKNGKGGNLLSTDVYGDFELIFEWKLAEGANNGIKYRVNNFDGRLLGIEYQLIDDLRQKSSQPKHRTASLYDIYEPAEHQPFRPQGEFNRSRIVVRHNRIEHWLNGHLVTEADVGNAEWNERISQSKFSDVDGFGITPVGHIMITDHGDEVWYRNIFIRRLDYVGQACISGSTAPTHCVRLPKRRVRRRCWRRW